MGLVFPGRLLLYVGAALCMAAQTTPSGGRSIQTQSNRRITIASGVRARSSAQTNSTLVETLQIGTMVQELERSQIKDTIANAEDYWYRVTLPSGRQAWIFGALLVPYEAARRDEIFHKIAIGAFGASEPRFGDQVDLVHFLERAAAEVTLPESIAELELDGLLALRLSLSSIPIDKREQQPYVEWTNEQREKIVYSEPAGQWFVRSELFWQLQKRFHSLAGTERIAWEAASNPLPGECEDNLACQFELARQTDGRYLKLYPHGEHAGQAVEGIAQTAKFAIDTMRGGREVFNVPSDERGSFQKIINELHSILSKQKTSRAVAVAKQLDYLSAHYR
jgi:hypothetical protein